MACIVSAWQPKFKYGIRNVIFNRNHSHLLATAHRNGWARKATEVQLDGRYQIIIIMFIMSSAANAFASAADIAQPRITEKEPSWVELRCGGRPCQVAVGGVCWNFGHGLQRLALAPCVCLLNAGRWLVFVCISVLNSNLHAYKYTSKRICLC